MSATTVNKHRRKQRLIIVQAAFWTVFLHAILFYGFSLTPRPVPNRLRLYGPTCALLRTPKRARRWERSLWAWSRIADPTLLALPNERLGFSRVRKEKRVLPYTEIPAYRYVTTYLPETVVRPTPLASPPPPLEKAVSLTWTDRLPPVPADPPLGSAPTRILWHFPDGRVIDDAPALPETILELALAKGKPTAPTGIAVIRSENRLRVAIRASCGNVDLDRMAYDALVRAAGEYQRRQSAGGAAGTASWFPGPGQNVLIEIEWRLAETGTSATDAATPPATP